MIKKIVLISFVFVIFLQVVQAQTGPVDQFCSSPYSIPCHQYIYQCMGCGRDDANPNLETPAGRDLCQMCRENWDPYTIREGELEPADELIKEKNKWNNFDCDWTNDFSCLERWWNHFNLQLDEKISTPIDQVQMSAFIVSVKANGRENSLACIDWEDMARSGKLNNDLFLQATTQGIDYVLNPSNSLVSFYSYSVDDGDLGSFQTGAICGAEYETPKDGKTKFFGIEEAKCENGGCSQNKVFVSRCTLDGGTVPICKRADTAITNNRETWLINDCSTDHYSTFCFDCGTPMPVFPVSAVRSGEYGTTGVASVVYNDLKGVFANMQPGVLVLNNNFDEATGTALIPTLSCDQCAYDPEVFGTDRQKSQHIGMSRTVRYKVNSNGKECCTYTLGTERTGCQENEPDCNAEMNYYNDVARKYFDAVIKTNPMYDLYIHQPDLPYPMYSFRPIHYPTCGNNPIVTSYTGATDNPDCKIPSVYDTSSSAGGNIGSLDITRIDDGVCVADVRAYSCTLEVGCGDGVLHLETGQDVINYWTIIGRSNDALDAGKVKEPCPAVASLDYNAFKTTNIESCCAEYGGNRYNGVSVDSEACGGSANSGTIDPYIPRNLEPSGPSTESKPKCKGFGWIAILWGGCRP